IAGAGLIVKEKGCGPLVASVVVSVAVTMAVNGPLAVGVPLSIPLFGSMAKPGGRPVAVQL
ncbi:MAG TPA: hypothetical protein VMG35_11110, partial [Bryobacteraceae bacterium]|nr:hypothetical protein [Bryobacteraceae bacterium]